VALTPTTVTTDPMTNETRARAATPVRIDVVTTRGGDGGQTSLGSGARVSKASLRIELLGALDEANASIGMIGAIIGPDHARTAVLHRVQSLLFDLGGLLCMPDRHPDAAMGPAVLGWLEAETEALRVVQPPLRSFVLPGGSPAAAAAHVARVTVRRAERVMAALSEGEFVPPEALQITNRLSDFFFVLARHFNDDGRADVPWVPGASG